MHDPSEMPARVEAFLRHHEPGRPARVTAYEPIAGGYSRLMARVEIEWGAPGEAVEREAVVVRGDPPPGTGLVDTDRDAEWALLAALTAAGGVPMPAARYYDATGELLGTKALVVDLAAGPSLLAHAGAAADPAGLREPLCRAAAAIHAVPLDVLPRTMPRPGSWDDYVDTRIAMWHDAADAHLEAEPFVRYVGAWLDTHRPPPAPLTLVHGDFQSANMLVGPDGDLAVVDWEFAHVGDPREDLGWFKAVAAAAPPDLIGLDDIGFCTRYCELTGASPDVVNPLTVGWFSLLGAVQIYAGILAQVRHFAEGTATGLSVPYNLNSMAFAHLVWMTVTGGLEAAMAAVEASS